MIRYLVLLFTTVILTTGNHSTYNRKILQKKYPGYGEEFVFFPKESGGYRKGYLKPHKKENSKLFELYDVEKDVTFTLYTREKPEGLLITDKMLLNETSLHSHNPTKFVTHGWMSSGTADTCITIKDAFLSKEDANVFIMDWGKIAGNVIYPIPMRATTDVAHFYAKFLNYLVDKNGVDPKKLHLVGHSLGAHISGFASRAVKKDTVSRVTGLDPALPGFDLGLVEGGRLTMSDADFVDVIHTCAGYLGIKTPIGHADFYPNGGIPPQPGCGNIIEMVEACSHGRSWKLFAESIVLPVPYMATPCESYEEFLQTRDCSGEKVAMGEPVPRYARGTYYLQTTDEAPFLMRGLPVGDTNRLMEN